jgi:ABC-2 type transport system ATP-binding protein
VTTDDRPPAIVVEGLAKRYGQNTAVDDISFHVDTGEVFALLGPNGAGKTSTIEMLEGFRSRDAGKVSVLGMDPSDRACQRTLRERLGVVLQDLAVEPFLSVEEVLSRSASYKRVETLEKYTKKMKKEKKTRELQTRSNLTN